MQTPTPTIPIIRDDDENEEQIRPMDWLFATDFILRRFLYVN